MPPRAPAGPASGWPGASRRRRRTSAPASASSLPASRPVASLQSRTRNPASAPAMVPRVLTDHAQPGQTFHAGGGASATREGAVAARPSRVGLLAQSGDGGDGPAGVGEAGELLRRQRSVSLSRYRLSAEPRKRSKLIAW